MNKRIILIGALLALALTVPVKAQIAPSAHPTSAQFSAMISASGVTLLSGQSAATVKSFQFAPSMQAPISTPVLIRFNFGLSQQEAFITSDTAAAIVAAGPTLTVSNPNTVAVALLPSGTYNEYSR